MECGLMEEKEGCSWDGKERGGAHCAPPLSCKDLGAGSLAAGIHHPGPFEGPGVGVPRPAGVVVLQTAVS